MKEFVESALKKITVKLSNVEEWELLRQGFVLPTWFSRPIAVPHTIWTGASFSVDHL